MANMVEWERILTARERIADTLPITPLLSSRTLNHETATQLWFKAENFQKTGSFKARGAFNRIRLAKSDPAVSGVVTASSGNHGQAVAFAARVHGLTAHIVVPQDASSAKIAAAEAYGATIEYCGTTSRERLERAEQLARQNGLVFVPPYDDVEVMAGQGTVGAEILEQLDDLDAVLVPIGGGGLISGVASAIKARRPSVQVIGVEPVGAASSYLSRQVHQRVELPAGLSIADGLRSVAPGVLTFPIIMSAVDHLVTVTDEQIRQAMWRLITRLKVLVEPSGACAAAYALAVDRPLAGQRVVAILSGGNVDPATLCRLLPS